MRNSQIVQVFPPDEVLRPEWSNWLEAANLTVIPFDEEQLEYTVCILLFTPIRSKDAVWISPEIVWKNYISTLFPDIKILQLGYHRVEQHNNYWHYTEPPLDANLAICSAISAKDWVPFDTLGTDLCQLWKKFRDGHDKGGFMDWFIGAKWEISTALSKLNNLNEGPKSAAAYLKNNPDADQAFENMKLRWVRYFSYFLATPFTKMISDLDSQVSMSYDSWIDIKKQKEIDVHLNKLESCFKGIDSLLLTIEPWFKYG